MHSGEAKEAVEVPLWPEASLPVKGVERVENRGTAAKPDRCVFNVQRPSLTVYRPQGDACGTAVIIFPGGAYEFLAIDKEGHQVAQWLRGLGITAMVLKYRLPALELMCQKPAPFLDGQRAVRLVRSRAAEWGVNRIGLLGFSAGAHLASQVGTRSGTEEQNSAEKISARPDFMVLVYPVITVSKSFFHERARAGLLGPHPPKELCESFSSELHVTAATPPTFLVHAKDDYVQVEHSLCFYEALQKAGVASELHVFEEGGHGYGLGIRGGEVATWPRRCEEWMRQSGFLPTARS